MDEQDTAEASMGVIVAYRFAGFRLSARRQHLERLEPPGESIALTTKLYHLLLTFAARPGEVIDKDTIVEAVWPGQVVTDAALAKQMQRLRDLLADGERDPPLIETHRGRGYRLTCEGEAEYAPQQARAIRESRRRVNPLRTWRAVLILAVATAAVVASITVDPLSEKRVETRAIAVLPVSDQATALSEGAAEYFATRLGDHADLAPELASEEYPARATEIGSLQLFRSRQRPVAAVQLSRIDEQYQLWLNLRGPKAVASTTMTGESIQRLLERGSDWISQQTGADLAAAPSSDAYALASYFQGLVSTGCDQAASYLQAAVTRDNGLTQARLRLLRCEEARGNTLEAASGAAALATLAAQSGNSALALEAHLLAAGAHRKLGNADAARRHLDAGLARMESAATPMQRMSALAAVAMQANLDGSPDEAIRAQQERLELAAAEYPIPQFIADIHLDIAEVGLVNGDYALMRTHAEAARELIEEFGSRESLVRSYRFLITSYFRANDMDAAVQLALAAGSIVDTANATTDKAYFMQFAAIALNGRGHLRAGREYSARLRQLEAVADNPIYGALADITIFHRLYAKGEYAEAYAFAASVRERIETNNDQHSSLPLALAFEAIAAARGAPVVTARLIIDRLERDYPDIDALRPDRTRAKGHVLIREGSIDDGIRVLREAEALYREAGVESVADYVGYEIAEIRLDTEQRAPWDDLRRLLGDQPANYQLARLIGIAHARDGNLLAATTELEKARLRGHELWSGEDQLLLERYRSALATNDSQRESIN